MIYVLEKLFCLFLLDLENLGPEFGTQALFQKTLFNFLTNFK